ncbi:single-stranded DNA-binding protein [Lactobacillus sp. UCMA15818]|uniref:single-stranded DNA-binding protein n=1 Tax=Lactobacillus sp. UCMA15818 TaxID=2583394 RepID=UPI0025AFDDDB|nr:single-stranded DNA-binding protein [Lactobacillus sp. UCMA15818]MDN2452547.1 single-stranded DNA-binding protein [Lactobacillus sp. UCMA15818]
MMNSVNLTGRLVVDPELRYSPSGTAYATSTIATQRNFKNQQGEYESDFIRLIASGKRAETFANFLHKGSLLGVSGEIRTGSYEKNGQKVYTTEVNILQIAFLESKSSNQNAQSSQQNNQYSKGKEIDVQDDDLPF